jgi:hypothetical protein
LTVSLLEVLAAARSHAAPLAAESAGYLLLAVADHVVAAPRAVQAEEVELAGDGSVRLRVRREPVEHREGVEPALRRLLAQALEVASSVGPGLRRAADRRDETGLSALVRELEVALIPVNRGAAKRALSRLHREPERARGAGKLATSLPVEVAIAEPHAAAAVEPPAAVELAPAVVPAPVIAAPPPIAVEPLIAAEPANAAEPVMAEPVALTSTPAPLWAEPELALTKPEPAVLRAKERGSSTPRLGTLITAQTLPGEESELTERAPTIEPFNQGEVELPIEAEAEAETPALSQVDEAVTPMRAQAAALDAPADPEPSVLPDVLTAMFELHTGMQADDAPTRLREVVTELLNVVQPVPLLTPEPQQVDDSWLTQSSLEDVATSAPLFVSERVEPERHEAVTWDPGPVTPSQAEPLPPALLIAEPAPAPSPYAPAVLPTRSSEVSDLLDSFHVSGAAEEGELRSALKEIAGVDLTPLPHPLAEER